MTREQKLALIIGFSLVLLVGVLISDHLSAVRQQSVAGVEDGEAGPISDGAGGTPAPADWEVVIPTPPSGSARDESPRSAGLASRSSAADRALRDEAAFRDSLSPGVESNWPASVPEVARGGAPRTETEPLLIPQSPDAGTGGLKGMVDEVRRRGGSLFQDGAGLEFALPTPRPAAVVDQSGPARSVESSDARTSSNPGRKPQESKPVAQPQLWHTVAKGESLYKIAERYYGKGVEWRRIADANPDRVGEDGVIREGVRLLIPGAHADDAKPAAPAPARPTARPKPAERRYTVRSGDTLGEISLELLGTSKRWREIAALNASKIRDEDNLQVGVVLAIPVD